MKEVLALLLALAMILSLAACGGQSTSAEDSTSDGLSESAEDSTSDEASESAEVSVQEAPEPEEEVGPAPLELPLADYDTTLSVWWAYPPWLTNTIEAADKPTFLEMTERTHVNLDVVGVSLFAASEQFLLMLASGSLTDIVMDFGSLYSGTYDQAIEEEVIIDLTEYIETVCPNYYNLTYKDEEVHKAILTNNGYIPAFMTINDDNAYIRGGHWVNSDLLAQTGREVPVTYDDWYDLLVAFRDELGIEYPLWIDASATSSDLTGAFDVIADFYQVDGEVKFGYLEDGFVDYLTQMHNWYAEGLVYTDFFTLQQAQDKPDADLVDNERVGIWRNAANNYADYTVSAQPIGQPVLEEGQTVHFSEITDKVQSGTEWVISASCENPEVAAKWIDYLYSDEGVMLTNYGIEGVSYEVVDGTPQFTNLITDNPDGLSFNNAMAIYCLFNTGGMYNLNNRMDINYEPVQIESRAIWADHNDDAYIYPAGATFTVDESEAYYNIYNDIDTYISEQLPQFIIGQRSMDSYDDFRETLFTMGIEECISLRQAALDRYNAR